MDHNEHFYPVGEAKPGKVIHVNLVTCKGCRAQYVLSGDDFRQAHRWWERLGWGKINPHPHGKSGKGDLYCPNCYPDAHREAVGGHD